MGYLDLKPVYKESQISGYTFILGKMVVIIPQNSNHGHLIFNKRRSFF